MEAMPPNPKTQLVHVRPDTLATLREFADRHLPEYGGPEIAIAIADAGRALDLDDPTPETQPGLLDWAAYEEWGYDTREVRERVGWPTADVENDHADSDGGECPPGEHDWRPTSQMYSDGWTRECEQCGLEDEVTR